MPNLLERMVPYEGVVFRLGEEYTLNELCNKIQQALGEKSIALSDDELVNELKNDLESLGTQILSRTKQERIEEQKFKFTFVGIFIPRQVNSLKLILETILFMIFPSWGSLGNKDEEKNAAMSTIMHGFLHYWRRNPDSGREQFDVYSTISNQERATWYDFDAMMNIITMTNRHGLLQETRNTQSKSKGEKDWKSTYQKQKPMFSDGVPVYPLPIRIKKTSSMGEIGRVHQACYDYCATYMSQFFRIPSRLKRQNRTEISLNELKHFLRVVSTEERKTRKYSQKERISLLRRFLERGVAFGPQQNNQYYFGMTEAAFHIFWERILHGTIGDEQLLQEINQNLRNSLTVSGSSGNRRQIIDGALYDEFGNIVLFDAKHYRTANMGVDVVLKQYSYEFSINQMLREGILRGGQSTNHVWKNAFISPKKDSSLNVQSLELAHQEQYAFALLNPYLARFFSPGLRYALLPRVKNVNEGVLGIEINGYTVIHRYIQRNRTGQREFIDFLEN